MNSGSPSTKSRALAIKEFGDLKTLQGDWPTSLYSLAFTPAFPTFSHHTCFLWECPDRVSYSNCFLENAHARWHHQSWNTWILKGRNKYNTTTWWNHLQKYLTASFTLRLSRVHFWIYNIYYHTLIFSSLRIIQVHWFEFFFNFESGFVHLKSSKYMWNDLCEGRIIQLRVIALVLTL